MDVEAYLQRIAYDGPRQPAYATLRSLHRQHLFTVPFENLDIRLGTPIRLDREALFDKIVTRRRGGFCYELNGLFCELLSALGFSVEMLSARVRREDGDFSSEFDHMLLKVSLQDEWIADVGFGESFLSPLPLPPATARSEDIRDFAVIASNRAWDLVRRQDDGSYVPLYRFTKAARKLADFTAMCEFHQSSRDSHFNRGRVCTVALPDGRLTVAGMRFIVTKAGARREIELKNKDELRDCLSLQFGIVLPDNIEWSRLTG
jgi:N-hydroxyarylamine O-acetyltransferase